MMYGVWLDHTSGFSAPSLSACSTHVLTEIFLGPNIWRFPEDQPQIRCRRERAGPEALCKHEVDLLNVLQVKWLMLKKVSHVMVSMENTVEDPCALLKQCEVCNKCNQSMPWAETACDTSGENHSTPLFTMQKRITPVITSKITLYYLHCICMLLHSNLIIARGILTPLV